MNIRIALVTFVSTVILQTPYNLSIAAEEKTQQEWFEIVKKSWSEFLKDEYRADSFGYYFQEFSTSGDINVYSDSIRILAYTGLSPNINTECREQAIALLAMFDTPQNRDTVRNYLSDVAIENAAAKVMWHWGERQIAVQILTRHQQFYLFESDSLALPYLYEAAKSEDPFIRFGAADQLTRFFYDETYLSVLNQASRDILSTSTDKSNVAGLNAAATYLATTMTEDDLNFLATVTSESQVLFVRWAALMALANAAHDSSKFAKSLIEQISVSASDTLIRERAFTVLKMLP